MLAERLGLEVRPPMDLSIFFDPDVLARAAGELTIPKKVQRTPPAKGRTKENNFSGLQASARDAALKELRQPEEAAPAIQEKPKRQQQRKFRKQKLRHAKTKVEAKVLPTPKPKLATKPEPESLAHRRRKAVKVTEAVVEALAWLADEGNEVRIAERIGIIKLQAKSAVSCASMSEFEELLPMLEGVVKLQKLLAKKAR